MKKVLILFGCVFSLLACTKDKQIAFQESCLNWNQAELTHFGDWYHKTMPTSGLSICLPTNSTMKLIVNQWKTSTHEAKSLLENMPIFISIPNESATEWRDENELYKHAFVYLDIIPTGQIWNGSVKDWVNSTFGKKWANTDKCQNNKTIADFKEPFHINFLSDVIKTKFIDGEAIQFEACRETGTWYGLLAEKKIFLIGYPHGYKSDNVRGEELLRKIIENLKMDSSAD